GLAKYIRWGLDMAPGQPECEPQPKQEFDDWPFPDLWTRPPAGQTQDKAIYPGFYPAVARAQVRLDGVSDFAPDSRAETETRWHDLYVRKGLTEQENPS